MAYNRSPSLTSSSEEDWERSMPNEPKSNDNPLADVAKAIGSSLGSAANRASELLRAATSGSLLSKPRTSKKPKSVAASRAKTKGKAPSKKKSSSRKPKAAAGNGPSKVRKSASGNKAK